MLDIHSLWSFRMMVSAAFRFPVFWILNTEQTESYPYAPHNGHPLIFVNPFEDLYEIIPNDFLKIAYL